MACKGNEGYDFYNNLRINIRTRLHTNAKVVAWVDDISNMTFDDDLGGLGTSTFIKALEGAQVFCGVIRLIDSPLSAKDMLNLLGYGWSITTDIGKSIAIKTGEPVIVF